MAGEVWASEWLNEVRAATVAIEREAVASALRREKATAIADPLGHGPHGKGGTSDPTARIGDALDAEAEAAERMPYANARLEEFDEMTSRIRSSCVGHILEGTYIAELRYKDNLSERQTCARFGIGRTRAWERLNALLDYLDHIGPARAFGDSGEN